ncbi:GNAT family N-acetyltransferase [Pseudoduganella sp. GCM10020061]|uniref:GNAT family N-acetyltransferase n=1 Tax=Pseudoduganella sp. GCM10020061 TaxID=3317345 RepID=UPI0036261226
MGIVVRAASDDDAQLIADLTRASWAGKIVETSSGHNETAEQVASDLRHGGAFILLSDGEPVGSVRWLPLDLDPDVWEIVRMGVLPGYRGANLSQHLLEAVIHAAYDRSATELRLAIRGDQPMLIDFYAAMQFELADELEHSHAGDAEPSPRVMRRHL